MKRLILWVLGFSLTLAQAGDVSLVTKAASALSLDQMYAVQTLLRARLDASWKVGEAPICANAFVDVSGPEVSMLPQLLEAEIQEKIRAMKESETLTPYLAEASRLASCSAKCRCDFYEAASGVPLKIKFKPLTNSSVLRCARANEFWICKSAVLKALAAEAKKAVSGNEGT